MAAYLLVELSVIDIEGYEEYKKLAASSITSYGGKYIIRGGQTENLEGNWQPERIAVLEFSNLVAFACKLSVDKGYEGYLSFESKTKLIAHYQKILGADLLFDNIMAIDTAAAVKLIDPYFPKNS